jgi:hypothetical protein
VRYSEVLAIGPPENADAQLSAAGSATGAANDEKSPSGE